MIQITNKKQTSKEMFCLVYLELLLCFFYRLFDENFLNRRTLAAKALYEVIVTRNVEIVWKQDLPT